MFCRGGIRFTVTDSIGYGQPISDGTDNIFLFYGPGWISDLADDPEG
jgi:hypothetical protein